MRIPDRSGAILYESPHETMIETVISAVVSGTDLTEADLRGADLFGANLFGVNLRGADLTDANLGVANLGGTDLHWANLDGANLASADLRGADLRMANLDGANLASADLRMAKFGGARLNWQSHWLLGHLLWRAAGDSVPHRKIAGLMALSTDWCWDRFLALDDPEQDWALGVLAGYMVEGDESPEAVRKARR